MLIGEHDLSAQDDVMKLLESTICGSVTARQVPGYYMYMYHYDWPKSASNLQQVTATYREEVSATYGKLQQVTVTYNSVLQNGCPDDLLRDAVIYSNLQ